MNKSYLFLLSSYTDTALSRVAKSMSVSRSSVVRRLIESEYDKDKGKGKEQTEKRIIRQSKSAAADPDLAGPYKSRILLMPQKVSVALSSLARRRGMSRSAVLRVIIKNMAKQKVVGGDQ